jgi:hypothetical protein
MEMNKEGIKNHLEISIVDDDEDEIEFLSEVIIEFSPNVKISIAANEKELMR